MSRICERNGVLEWNYIKDGVSDCLELSKYVNFSHKSY